MADFGKIQLIGMQMRDAAISQLRRAEAMLPREALADNNLDVDL